MSDSVELEGYRDNIAATFQEGMAVPCISYRYRVPDKLCGFAKKDVDAVLLGILADDCLVKMWMDARSLFEPGNDRCLASVLAADYAAVIQRDVWELAIGLKPIYVNEEKKRFWLANLLGGIQRAEINLSKAFEAELKKDSVYYLGDELEVLLKKAESELNTVDESEFSTQLCVLIRHFECDVNKRANAFAEAAYKGYLEWASSIQGYVKKIETNL